MPPTMSEQTNSEDPVQRGLDELKSIGKEIGGRLKDAGEDVKDAWQKLQPRIAKADEFTTKKTDELTGEVQVAATAVIDDLKDQLQKLKEKLDKK